MLELLTCDNAKTQKAQGLVYLQQAGLSVPIHWVIVPQAEDKHLIPFPVFARPCPKSPRHGFVNSIIAYSINELIGLYNAMLKEDAEGQLLITTYISGYASGVYNNGTLFLGAGNSGVTDGTSAITELPICASSNSLGLLSTDHVEIVYHKHGKAYFVQKREGPVLQGNKTFYLGRERLEVKRCFGGVLDYDLIEWEKMCKTPGGFEEGTLVILNSLASHYASHCIINKIPVALWSAVPTPPFVLEEKVEIRPFKSDRFFGAFWNALSLDAKPEQVITAALYGIHNYPAISNNDVLIGGALGYLVKAGYSVCRGEHRHCRKVGLTREQHYGTRIRGRQQLIRGLTTLYRDFGDTLLWEDSYGGWQWRDCVHELILLYNAVVSYNVGEAILIAHSLLNMMHNNGMFLDKLVDQVEMDMASDDPLLFTLLNGTTLMCLMHSNYNIRATPDQLSARPIALSRVGFNTGASWRTIGYTDDGLCIDVNRYGRRRLRRPSA